MADYYRRLTFAEVDRFSFLRTLLSDPYVGQLPRYKPETEVMTLLSTQDSPREIRLEYGTQDSYGQYSCHALLTRGGQFKERTCSAFYENGQPTLARGVPAKQARDFFRKFPMPPKPKPTITLPPVRVTAASPMVTGGTIVFLPRASMNIQDEFLSEPAPPDQP